MYASVLQVPRRPLAHGVSAHNWFILSECLIGFCLIRSSRSRNVSASIFIIRFPSIVMSFVGIAKNTFPSLARRDQIYTTLWWKVSKAQAMGHWIRKNTGWIVSVGVSFHFSRIFTKIQPEMDHRDSYRYFRLAHRSCASIGCKQPSSLFCLIFLDIEWILPSFVQNTI